jgi:phosphoglycolate phosphatase-like HAD superfamily hydrolase
MKKMLVFDMDGTIANLYGVENWLNDLRNEKVDPYVNAKPLYNMDEMSNVLNKAKSNGWRVAVTTWLAKDASRDYDKAVAEAKKAWLAKYDFPYDEIHCLKYGRTKANATRKKADFQVLIDDNKKVRDGWTLGTTVNAEYSIMNFLKRLA